jgi:hypothetical protein
MVEKPTNSFLADTLLVEIVTNLTYDLLEVANLVVGYWQ